MDTDPNPFRDNPDSDRSGSSAEAAGSASQGQDIAEDTGSGAVEPGSSSGSDNTSDEPEMPTTMDNETTADTSGIEDAGASGQPM